MSNLLGSARWETQTVVSQRYPFAKGHFWLGRSEDDTAIGYPDDRHICLVSGNRGGKGTSLIVNNLCFWPGSAVVVDPKGENATVTAARRGKGSEYCEGLGQAVHVLDPFRAAQVEESYRSCFNPLDALDPTKEETIDEASRLASALVVINDKSNADPFWDESARSMLRGLILYVLTAEHFSDDERNLITVRNLILRGEWEIAELIREQGHSEETIDPPHLLLWRAMEKSAAFNGLVAGFGARFRTSMKASDKTFDGILQAVMLHTEFLDSPGMRRVLASSDFELSELKTRPEGMTLYLSLPQRYMDTHYRWLRMMVALTTSEMEITRGRPATGYPVLMVLDEFAGLKRMTAIENAVAQIAGFGVKLFFVLQSLEQLKATYKDSWETFLANAGVKIFFSIEDHFTREYVSKLAGETEIIRELQSSNESQSDTESYAEGQSQSKTRSRTRTRGSSKSKTRGTSFSWMRGTSQSANQSYTEGVNQSRNASESRGINESTGWSRGSSSSFNPSNWSSTFGGNQSVSGSRGSSYNTSQGFSEGTSSSASRGTTDGTSNSGTRGQSDSNTAGTSDSEAIGESETVGTTQTRTRGTSRTAGTGRSESIYKRPLVQPDEVGRFFARIEKNQEGYPGLALVMIAGANPLVVRRSHYFEDPEFIDCFSAHPDHEFSPAVLRQIYNEFRSSDLEDLESANKDKPLQIAQWLVQPGKAITAGQAVAIVENVPPDSRTVNLRSPWSGKVSKTEAKGASLSKRESKREKGVKRPELFTIKTYEAEDDNDTWEALKEFYVAHVDLEIFRRNRKFRLIATCIGVPLYIGLIEAGFKKYEGHFANPLPFLIYLLIVPVGIYCLKWADDKSYGFRGETFFRRHLIENGFFAVALAGIGLVLSFLVWVTNLIFGK